MQIYEILEKATALLEKGWTRNVLAKDRLGDSVPPTDPNAVQFCALGALIRVSGEWDMKMAGMAAERLLNKLIVDSGWNAYKQPGFLQTEANVYGEHDLATYNNMMGQAATVELFKKATRMAKEQAGIPIEVPEETNTKEVVNV